MKNQAVIKELERIRRASGGLLLPEKVVAAARPKTSVLHSRFEWDNSEAAEKYRIWQARQLISICVEILPGSKVETPCFVSLSPDRVTRGGYRAIVDVMSHAEMREQLLKDALHDLNSFQQRYHRLKELSEVFSAIRRVRKAA